jgi:hypothetical protein
MAAAASGKNRIRKDHKSDKHKIAFVFARVLDRTLDDPVSYREHSESFSPEPLVDFAARVPLCRR